MLAGLRLYRQLRRSAAELENLLVLAAPNASHRFADALRLRLPEQYSESSVTPPLSALGSAFRSMPADPDALFVLLRESSALVAGLRLANELRAVDDLTAGAALVEAADSVTIDAALHVDAVRAELGAIDISASSARRPLPAPSLPSHPAIAGIYEVNAALAALCPGLETGRDYGVPENSYISSVLRGQGCLGVPLTLSVIYAALAERRGVSLAGTRFPAHFLLRAAGADDAAAICSEEDHNHLLGDFIADFGAVRASVFREITSIFVLRIDC